MCAAQNKNKPILTYMINHIVGEKVDYITKCEEVYEYELGIINTNGRACRGGREIGNQNITTFDIAHKCGVSKRGCQEMLRIVKNIPLDERMILKTSRIANKRSVLTYLSSLDNQTRSRAIEEILERETKGLPSFPTEREFVVEINNHLKSLGYDVENEVKTPLGYVDIVATKGDDVMIIEVKNNSGVSAITKALGQILCYAYCIPNTTPYVCTPTLPSDDSLKLLQAYNIKFLDIRDMCSSERP